MLKLLGLDVVLAAAGNLYLLLAVVCVCLALWKGRTLKRKLVSAVLVLGLFMAPIAPGIYQGVQYQIKLSTAQTMFAERCKTAGEKIYKTVDNVEGIFLLKIRTTTNHGDQFQLDDPYGHDVTGDGYILNFLRGYHHQHGESFAPGSPPRLGYFYIEAQDPIDGQRYHYTAAKKSVRKMNLGAPNVVANLKRDPNYDLNVYEFVLEKSPALGASPRYGVTFDDISTHEERQHWIAGSSLKVIDLQTNEVIAERIGYMVDWAQGSTAGQRSPWLFAADNACPGFHRNPLLPPPRPAFSAQPGQTIDFVEKILIPVK